MIFDWYKIVNRPEFLATGLPSREIQLILDGVGAKTALVTVGNLFSITIDDVMLSLGMTDHDPFVFEDRAIYEDVNGDVWWGILVS